MDSHLFTIELCKEKSTIPYDLLLLADPSLEKIKAYTIGGFCFTGSLEALNIAVMVLIDIGQSKIELKNLAVAESHQNNGYGKLMLDHAINFSNKNGFKQLIVATGNSSSRPLKIYQEAVFVISHIEKDYFLKEYEEPIFEHGVQCVDRVVLVKAIGF